MSEVDFDGYLNEQLGDVDPAEQTDEAATETVARDEQGRFTAAAEETPAETEETPAEPEQTQEPELILGKYKTQEEANKAHEHAQREIGRLGQELGDLRKQVQAPPEQEYDLSGADEVDDPALAASYAVHALRQGDEIAYQKAIRSWAELDQVGAMDFHARRVGAEQEQRLQQQFGPSLENARQAANRDQLGGAAERVAARRPDFNDVIGSLTEQRVAEIVESGFPTQVLRGLQGGPQEQEAVFETLYRWVKSEQAEHVASVTQENDQATLAQKAQAAVASASTTAVDTTDDSSPHLQMEGFDGTLSEFHKLILAPSPTSFKTRGGQ